MKKIKIFLFAIILFTGGLSCKKSFLDEKPLDFLSTSNAFKTEADFNASVNNLYGLVRQHFYTINDFSPFYYQYKTDAFFDATVTTPNMAADMGTRAFTNFAWSPNYKIISEANTILSRLSASSLTDAQMKVFEARAKFFRAFAYRTLAYLYGGVPLVLEEITTPKTDFVRATRKEVYTQIIEDLKFAVANLPSLAGTIKDGEVSKQAANHLLSEVYLADGQFQNSVDAATAVIGDAAMGLMTTRFGRRSTVTPGDVYWDLFQRGNQNRKSGNREAIWVIQIETDVPGGGGSTSGGSQFGVYALERVHAPLLRDMRINGIAPFLWPIANYTGGRGVGFLAPDAFFITDIWQSDFNNDIRNANHNFVRDYYGNNPASPYFGKLVSTRNPPPGSTNLGGTPHLPNKPERTFYPYQSKATQVYEPPQTLVSALSGVPASIRNIDSLARFYLTAGAGGTYIDQYMFRLAETYLIRAEAYLGLNKTTEAAADINTVRARSSATAILPGQVTLDFILDERLREFGVEEKRMLTLMRLGKWVDRVRRFNPFYGTQMQDYYNLWPIPADEIERNRSAKLEQNPGYPQ